MSEPQGFVLTDALMDELYQKHCPSLAIILSAYAIEQKLPAAYVVFAAAMVVGANIAENVPREWRADTMESVMVAMAKAATVVTSKPVWTPPAKH